MTRKEIKSFVPYVPGKPVDEVKRELGLKKIIKLASNENAYGTSEKARAAYRRASENLHIYPESSSFYLRKKLSAFYGLPESMFITGNGSDELIELLGKVFLEKTDNIVVSEHAFIRYAMAGMLMGCRIKSLPMKDYKHDLDAMARAVDKKTKLVFIANPNNPTGTYNTDRELFRLLESLKKRNLLVVIDEAYYEFISAPDYPQTVQLLKKFDNLVILRTFSKIYGLAALRIGYGICSQKIISEIDRIRPPFNVNSAAQAAAAAALDDRAFVRKVKKEIENGRQTLYSGFDKLGLEYLKSQANFVLVKTGKGKEVFRSLLKKGIIVRAMDEYSFPDWIRVTAGKKEENEAFLEALKGVVSK